jgi:regulator of nonsense transcripts 2
MDIEFVVQDTYSLLRPQWKLITSDLTEAHKVFAEACKQNYRDVAAGKTQEPEDLEDDIDADDARPDGNDLADIDGDGAEDKSGEDDDAEPTDDNVNGAESDEEEHIVVTRPEDQRDPEADADFDRELAKLMAESAESRKFDRKPIFDVPLPMRRTVRDATTSVAAEENGADSRAQSPADGPGMMRFALLSKKGPKQQVCTKNVCRARSDSLTRAIDTLDRFALRLYFRRGNAHTATSRTRGATAYQESGLELRLDR